MVLRSNFFLIFWKITMKKQHDGVYVLLHCRSQELKRFLGNFLEFQEQIIGRITVKGTSEIFNIFSLNFSIVYLSCSKPFTADLSFVENFY